MTEDNDLNLQVADPPHDPETDSSRDEVLYCTVHPDVATSLRCNKCGRPMCTQCAVRTPVGYRCRECVRGQQAVFFNARSTDYLIAGVVSFLLSVLGGAIVPRLGIFFAIILSPFVGSLIAQAVQRLTGRRRGEYTGVVVVAGIILGALPALWTVVQLLFLGAPLGVVLSALLLPGAYVGIVASVAYGWFRYGKL